VQDGELLERERELRVLSALITAACRGEARLVVVEGVAGIGKTRLLAAARAEGERAGMLVLGARGAELAREFAYGVVRQLFEPVLTGAGHGRREELLSGVAAQAAALFGYVNAADVSSTTGDMSFATLHGLFWLTANLCTHEPLILVVDDLHWSDVPSLRFLAYLLLRLEGLPLLVIVGLRPAELVADQHLVAQITTDPLATTIRPRPLSPAASTRLVRTVLAEDAEEEFCLACHTASGGNPLLLHELLGVAQGEGLEATTAGAARLAKLGPRAIRQRVALRLTKLGPAATTLCAAVAILGDGADTRQVVRLSGLELMQTLQTARQLRDNGILYRQEPSPEEAAQLSDTLRFVHPLIRAAVYEGLSETERLTGHTRAAHLLSEGGKLAEQAAAHLLLIPPAADSFVVTILRRAADEAFARGSPDSAVVYLERCLEEPPPDTDRADILLQLGTAAQLVDMAKGATYLTAAMAAGHNAERKATIAEMLGMVLHMAGRGGEAVNVLSQVVGNLGEHDSDLSLRLEGVISHVGLVDPIVYPLAVQRVNRLRDATPDTGFGSRVLDLVIALYDAFTGQPKEAVVERARRGLADESIIVDSFASGGCFVLIAADQDEVMALLDKRVAEAYRCGSLLVLAPTKWLQGLAWLARGHSPRLRRTFGTHCGQLRLHLKTFLNPSLLPTWPRH